MPILFVIFEIKSTRVKLLNPDKTKTLQISAKKFDFFHACLKLNEGFTKTSDK